MSPDPQLLAAIVAGVFGGVVSPMVKHLLESRLKRTRAGAREGAMEQVRRGTDIAASAGGLLVFALLGYFVLGPLAGPMLPRLGPPAVSITAPAAGSSVSRLTLIQGKAKGIPSGL